MHQLFHVPTINFSFSLKFIVDMLLHIMVDKGSLTLKLFITNYAKCFKPHICSFEAIIDSMIVYYMPFQVVYIAKHFLA